MKKKIRDYVRGYNAPDLDVRERLFRFITFFGSLAITTAVIESIIMKQGLLTICAMAFADVVILISMFIAYKFKRMELAVVLIGLCISVLILPQVFFLSGGIDGGISIWLILGYVYIFLMFSGKKQVFFVALNIVMNIVTYWTAYHFPNIVYKFDTTRMEYRDSVFSLIMVGLFCGIVMNYQIQIYIKEFEKSERQKKEIEEANNAQNLFFAGMSHEIRTPMNSIIGLNEMILRKSDDEEIKEYARDIQSSGKMLLGLINDVLDMSQLKQNRMTIVPAEYDSEKMFRDVIEMLSIRMAEKKLDFIVRVDETMPRKLYGDAKRIQQIMINILTNAIKYTNEGSVRLEVSQTPCEGDQILLQLVISDTGMGIRKEELNKLYDTFQRIDLQKNTAVEGSGLGMSITKQLVDLMEGEIKVDSIYTKGSTFTVTIRQKIVDAEPIGNQDFLRRVRTGNEQYSRSFEAPEARILVVDDSEINAKVIEQLLRDTKVQVDVASSGVECLTKTRQRYYHVILMDYMMPDMDGTEVFKIIRKQENGLCLQSPVILLTANNADVSKRIVEENNFSGYLEKPVEARRLEAEILRLLPEDVIEYRREDVYAEQDDEVKFSYGRKKRLLVTTDCVADLPEYLLEKYDIRVMYLYVRTPYGRFADTKEIDSDNLIQIASRQGEQVCSDSASVEEYEEFFAKVLTEAEEIIHISLAANSGKTYNVAFAAAQGFDHVTVIDAQHISCGQGLLVLSAAKMLKEDKSKEEICEMAEALKNNIECQFLISEAAFFARNGYMKKGIANLLDGMKAKPVIRVNHKSRIRLHRVIFGPMDKALVRFINNTICKKSQIEPGVLFVTYTGLSYAEQEKLRATIEKRFHFERIVMNKSSFSTSCNAGLCNVGIAYYRFPK